jgi:hypothetical protein
MCPLATSLVTLADYSSIYAFASQAAGDLFLSLVTSFFSLSLAENALVTGLIITKILLVYREIQGLECRVGRDIAPIISILIESGVITFLGQLLQTSMYKFENIAYPIVGRPVVMLYVSCFF